MLEKANEIKKINEVKKLKRPDSILQGLSVNSFA
jgi:hypothetical protein